jgi:hypothetical protein
MSDAKKKKPDWRKIKAAYQKGEGSCRELSERFGVNFDALRSKCFRDKWKIEKQQIEAKVVQRVEDALTLGALAWVNQTIVRAEKYRAILDATQDQCGTDQKGRPLIDPEELDKMSRTEQRVDDIARRAFGLPDTPQKVDLKQSIEIIEIVNPYSKPDEPTAPETQSQS